MRERVERDETWQRGMQAIHRFKEKMKLEENAEKKHEERKEREKRERKEKWTNAKRYTPLVWTTF